MVNGYYSTINGNKRHAWIIDGVVERSKYPVDSKNRPISNTIVILPPLLHCVWGWNTNADGYYAYLYDEESGDYNLDDTSTQGYFFENQYKIQLVFGGLGTK